MNNIRNKFSPEFRGRAVRMVEDHRGDYPSEWAALTSSAGKVGCTIEMLRRWFREQASRRAEVIWRQRSWSGVSAVEMAKLRWVDWFDNHRLFGPIGHIPPAEAEANSYAAIENLDMVA